MKKTRLPISLLVILMALLTSCAPTTSANYAVNRVLNVTGQGSVKLEPDIVSINIGVQSRSSDAGEALKENTRNVQAIIDILLDMGVENKDIQTRNFNIYQQQDVRYLEEESETTSTYVVDNTVTIIVREIDALGEILTKVVNEGANTINSINFDVEDRDTPTDEARKLAIEDAKTQAEEIAKTAGVKLGAIQTIDVSTSSSIIPRTAYAVEEAVGGGSVPISSGTLNIEVTVYITYAIE